MEREIYITRRSISEVMTGGLSRVDVWFCEPCLNVEIATSSIYSPWDVDDEYDKLYKELQGILFGQNVIHNFIYRKDNRSLNHNLEFGDNLVCNGSGEEFPQVLIDLYEERRVRFRHGVFGSGNRVNYVPNNVANLFGYDSELSEHIWKLVCEDIDPKDEYKNLYEWDRISDKDRPWWRFCKKVEISINLNVDKI